MDGILAVFVAGLAFNHGATGPDRADDVSIDEAVNRFLVLPLFVGFGVVLPWSAWSPPGWHGPALLGWFGPIGVSALFYLALEAERLAVDPVVLAAGSLVVAASTVVHGTTSAPGRLLYRRAARPATVAAQGERAGKREE